MLVHINSSDFTRHSTRVRVGHLPTGRSLGWPRMHGAGSKYKILLPRSFVPQPTEYTCQVSAEFHRSRPSSLTALGF